MNQSTWLEEGHQLYRTHQNSQFQIGDWVNVGIQSFGRTEAFDAAQQITGTKNTRNFYTRCAAMASLYGTKLRFPKLNFHTYEVLARFPLSFLEQFIPEVAESGRSCKQIYFLAVERYGSDPRRDKTLGEFHVVRLPGKLYSNIAVHASSPNKAHLLVVQILTDWERQQPAPPANPSAGNEADDSGPRPTYAERRAAQKAEKLAAKEQYKAERRAAGEKRAAEKLAARQRGVDKEMRKAEKKLARISFTTCKGARNFVDTESGPVKLAAVDRPTRFSLLEAALTAARKYTEAKGYVVIPYTCKACSNGHPVWHLRAAAEVDLSSEQAEVRATVEGFIQSTRASLHEQHAQV